jgi:hypothetical protein
MVPAAWEAEENSLSPGVQEQPGKYSETPPSQQIDINKYALLSVKHPASDISF